MYNKLMKNVLVLFLMLGFFGVVEAKEVKVAASIYPVYIMARNVIKDMPGVSVADLNPQTHGCPHDYALTTADMKKLASADILFANGAGMEVFLSKVATQYPRLKIVELAQANQVIDGNPHLWLSVSGAIMQVKRLGMVMEEVDPDNAQAYRKNTDAYVVKLEKLGLDMYRALARFRGAKIITLHDAFPYFADEFGLNIVAVVERGPGGQPSAKELSEIITLIKKSGVKAILSDEDYPVPALETISQETGVPVYFINTAVNGPDDPDAYLDIMRKNTKTLQEALK